MRAALYARVSTTDRQSPETQLLALREYAQRREFEIRDEWVDRASGRKDSRKAFAMLLQAARRREIDVVIVAAYDRLSRSLQELVNTAGELEALGIHLVSLREGTDTTTPQGKLLFGFMATLAEFESPLIVERIRSGLDRARAEGKPLGRPKIPEWRRRKAVESRRKGLSLRAIALELGIGHSSVARILRAYEEEHGRIEIQKFEKVELRLYVENNSKWVRGKKRSVEEIERYVLSRFEYEKPAAGDYIVTIPYTDDADLDATIDEIFSEAWRIADSRHCFVEADARSLTRDKYWD